MGGGLARQGGVCGAVSGALMVIGLKFGNDDPAGKENTYRIAQEYLRQFKETHPSMMCRELTGMELSSPDSSRRRIQA